MDYKKNQLLALKVEALQYVPDFLAYRKLWLQCHGHAKMIGVYQLLKDRASARKGASKKNRDANNAKVIKSLKTPYDPFH